MKEIFGFLVLIVAIYAGYKLFLEEEGEAWAVIATNSANVVFLDKTSVRPDGEFRILRLRINTQSDSTANQRRSHKHLPIISHLTTLARFDCDNRRVQFIDNWVFYGDDTNERFPDDPIEIVAPNSVEEEAMDYACQSGLGRAYDALKVRLLN